MAGQRAVGRDVVVKVRPGAPRLHGCTAVQRHLHRAGFRCPEPLTGPRPLGPLAASAETYVRVVTPPGSAVPGLDPPPPWVWWNHDRPGVWPVPDDRDADLNALPEPVVVGAAAAVFPASGTPDVATVDEIEEFLAAYEQARGRTFTTDERECCWAAGLWPAVYNAKKEHLDGSSGELLARLAADATARLARAGA